MENFKYQRLKNKSVYIGLSPSKHSLRLGELRTFIYIYSYARKNNLPVYLRIDDTNPDSKDETCIESILREFNEIGIILSRDELTYWQGDLLFQSKQNDTYKYFFKKLADLNVLSENNGLISVDINKVVNIFEERFIEISKDLIRRKTKFNIRETGYHYIPIYIINEDRFLFHLPCVIDEYLLNTTTSIRGEDKMPLIPIHDILRFLLGFPIIEYLHLPLLLMPDSNKRLKGNDFSLENTIKSIDKDKLINYLIKSGYNDHTKKQLTISDFIQMFDFKKIKKQSNHFNSHQM